MFSQIYGTFLKMIQFSSSVICNWDLNLFRTWSKAKEREFHKKKWFSWCPELVSIWSVTTKEEKKADALNLLLSFCSITIITIWVKIISSRDFIDLIRCAQLTVKISAPVKCITAGAFKIKELIDNFPWTFTKEQQRFWDYISKLIFKTNMRKWINGKLKSKKCDQEYGSNITACEKWVNSKRR